MKIYTPRIIVVTNLITVRGRGSRKDRNSMMTANTMLKKIACHEKPEMRGYTF